MGELIAVLSGKGGTGKTSICAALAQALCVSGESVLCIDCDVGLRNLDIALGLSEECAISFADICDGAYTLEDAAGHPVYPTLSFLTAPVGCNVSQIDRDAFDQMLSEARKKYSYILLDAPAGVEEGFSLAARVADRILLVTQADPAAIRDAQRAGQLLELMGKDRVRLIVNRVKKKQVAQMKLTVDDIMDQTGLPLIGLVPEDPNVTMAATFRQPLLGYTRKGAASACRRIAKRIQGHTVPVGLK